MSIKSNFIAFITLTFFSIVPLAAESWKVFFYMEASDGLTDMAIKNITDMMRAKPNSNVDWVIQLHAYDNKALRYQVTQQGLQFFGETPLSGDSKHDFVDAASWAFANNSADHIMLIFSNHGWGALDPRWNEETQSWEVAGLNLSNDEHDTCNGSNVCPLNPPHKDHKGFMFSAEPRTYLTNRAMAEGLADLYTTILNNKKIDVIAFDTCMGSMLEVATCIAPYANYLVGVQSCALRDGFDYQGFIRTLNQGFMPQQTVSDFVHIFDTYYAKHDAKGIYTCAALDLARVDATNYALNNLVTELLAHPEWLPLLQEARAQSPRFCLWPIYTDLVAFCKLIEEQLRVQPESSAIETVVQSLHELDKTAQTMVVSRCGGYSTTDKAHGFSIYLPPHAFEESYLNSVFAEHSSWPQLLLALRAYV